MRLVLRQQQHRKHRGTSIGYGAISAIVIHIINNLTSSLSSSASASVAASGNILAKTMSPAIYDWLVVSYPTLLKSLIYSP